MNGDYHIGPPEGGDGCGCIIALIVIALLCEVAKWVAAHAVAILLIVIAVAIIVLVIWLITR